MSSSNNVIDDIVKSLDESLNKLKDYRFEIGVFTGKSKRKVQIGITNAELMFVHENGSPLRNIPARPVLQMTIEYASQNLLSNTINKCIDLLLNGASDNDIQRELERLALKIENYARRLIYSNDGRLAPNAPSTIARKGDNHPLFDTGQLARSITCRVVKS